MSQRLNNNVAWLNSTFDVKKLEDKEKGTKSLVISGYANTVTQDRAGDVIPSEAWLKPKALNNYLKNPIVLFQHDHDEPIGKMLSHSVTEQGLFVEIEIFDVDSRVYKLVEAEVLKAFSVGFRITDYAYDVDEDIFTITELELFEISVVSIPCNQDSLFDLQKSMTADSYKSMKEEVRKLTSASAEPTFNTELEKLAYALGYYIKE